MTFERHKIMLSCGEQDGKRQLGEIHFWRDGFMGGTTAAAQVFSSAELRGLKLNSWLGCAKHPRKTSAASFSSQCFPRHFWKLQIRQDHNFSHRGGAKSPLTAAAVYIRQNHNWLPVSLKPWQTQLAAAGSSFPHHQRQVNQSDAVFSIKTRPHAAFGTFFSKSWWKTHFEVSVFWWKLAFRSTPVKHTHDVRVCILRTSVPPKMHQD